MAISKELEKATSAYLVSVIDDVVRAPPECHVVHVHARGLPHLNQVLTNILFQNNKSGLIHLPDQPDTVAFEYVP